MIPAIVDSAQQPVGRLTCLMRGAVRYRNRAVKTSRARCLRVSDAVRHICELAYLIDSMDSELIGIIGAPLIIEAVDRPARSARYRIEKRTDLFSDTRILPVMLLVVLTLMSCVRRPVHEQAPESFRQFIIVNNLQEEYRALERFLYSKGVRDLVPTWQLLQQGTDFRQHNLSPYAFPERELWDRMAKTLTFIRVDLVPRIGPVEVLSGFRTKDYNFAAGGAPRSRHLTFSALDLRPLRKIERKRLHATLQKIWHSRGEKRKLGMGLYQGLSFHIDTGGYRQW